MENIKETRDEISEKSRAFLEEKILPGLARVPRIVETVVPLEGFRTRLCGVKTESGERFYARFITTRSETVKMWRIQQLLDSQGCAVAKPMKMAPCPRFLGASCVILEEWIGGRTINPTNATAETAALLGRRAAEIHNVLAAQLPVPRLRRPFMPAKILRKSAKRLRSIRKHNSSYFGRAELSAIRAFFGTFRAVMRRQDIWCWAHNKFQDGNVMRDDSGNIAVIDLATFAPGHPVKDIMWAIQSILGANSLFVQRLLDAYFDASRLVTREHFEEVKDFFEALYILRLHAQRVRVAAKKKLPIDNDGTLTDFVTARRV